MRKHDLLLFSMRHLITFVLYNTKAFKGVNNELVVAVEKFHPQVICQSPLESDKESCGEILTNMSHTYSPCRFGPPGDRTVDYIAPYSILSSKNNQIPNYE